MGRYYLNQDNLSRSFKGANEQRFLEPAVNKEEGKGLFERQQQSPMATKQGIKRHFCSTFVEGGVGRF